MIKVAADSPSANWTRMPDVLRALRRRWDNGDFLGAYARGEQWSALGMRLRGPTASQLASDYQAAREWVARWQSVADRASRSSGLPTFHLEYHSVGGRLVGTNEIPVRLWVDDYDALWTLLGVEQDVEVFDGLVSATEYDLPALVPWMRAKPLKVLANASQWPRLTRTMKWIAENSGRRMYLREIDIPGIDTKFIESNRSILCELLDTVLCSESIDETRPVADFAGRYHFRKKPEYVRFRHLDGTSRSSAFTELTVRVDEFATATPGASTVYIVENEITYLALPPTRDAIAIFGAGYALSRLKPLAWLHEKRLCYWGDLDTHGFSILNQLRTNFQHTESLLMDRTTLLAHESQWVTEPNPTAAALPMLTSDESALYRDLVENTYGHRIRLEQERITFSEVRRRMDTTPTQVIDQ